MIDQFLQLNARDTFFELLPYILVGTIASILVSVPYIIKLSRRKKKITELQKSISVKNAEMLLYAENRKQSTLVIANLENKNTELVNNIKGLEQNLRNAENTNKTNEEIADRYAKMLVENNELANTIQKLKSQNKKPAKSKNK